MITETNNQQPTNAFDKATNTVSIGTSPDGKYYYAGTASKDWCIGEVPHGGYVLALVTDAVLRHFSTKFQQDPVALNCFYLRKTSVGPYIVEIQDVKTSSKGYCVVRASLLQAKDTPQLKHVDEIQRDQYTEKVHVIFTMGNMDNEKGVTHFHEPYQPPSRDVMVPYKHTYMGNFIEGLVDQSSIPKDHVSGIGGKAYFNQLLKFTDGRDIDFKSIPYWCDMFVTPPILLGWDLLGGPVWCPTMQLEVQFKRKPTGKEVLTSIVAPHIINNRFDCSGGVWDTDGNLLALTRHQCLIVPWSRNAKSGGTAPKARF
ncbi:hypothetical protein LRAMOSA06923 [Lichtheimia ramosa]|uniref:Uncharacterized protein n=1 Tax=Lichtheimia ramosa TaxID=688394 RepID=A0A077WCR6_9FUNG|nr:hypothetical protein LRAMOSA06923 [Lichtheimia ramosa]